MNATFARRSGQHHGALAGLVALVLLLVTCAVAAQGTPWQADTGGLAPIPKLSARVTDETNTLSGAQRQALDAKLADWEQRTGNQLVVLVVPTTKPEPIESYSIRVAEAWKIGRKGQDNGAIFLVAKDDHKMRFAEGIDAAVDRIIAVVGSGAPLPAKAPAHARGNQPFDFGTLLIFLFVGVPLVGGLLSRIFGRMLGSTIAIGIGVGLVALFVMLLFSAGGGIGRRGGMWIPTGGWGGGGLGGGGFGGGGGGFSGGGGSFGGGGASGGW